nr:alginate lyase family protein [uncultured Dyadobacter sp.]
MKATHWIRLSWHIGRQMGIGYVLFRIVYAFCGWSGLLRLRFPRSATKRSWISLAEWESLKTTFFFGSKEQVVVIRRPDSTLAGRAARIKQSCFRYFSSQWFEVSDWHTNPITGYRYPERMHWTAVKDFVDEAGDIKFVWEKSRFTFLYDLIRYDHHFQEDQSDFVLSFIENWIDRNPVNCGPNWKCSQEIAIRVLNWTFALHYYRFSPALSQPLLDKILCSIYDQMRHVAGNIRFSLVAVRNNHVLTEALGLFAIGLLFPFFPESQEWKRKGKDIFEREIVAQIAADGTYLQFSMNYHRVVIQLLSWALRLGELNDERLLAGVYERARASRVFLSTCGDSRCGWLPNYGNNDGALFFPLTECHFRDFRPQLTALGAVLGERHGQETAWQEESEWIMGKALPFACETPGIVADGAFSFPKGGYYLIRNDQTLTFLRCGSYYSRPFQADHLHLDIWVDGRNLLRDAGTWLYHADSEQARHFWGTAAHNTVTLGEADQMQKRQRFIWTHWISNAHGAARYEAGQFEIEAEFEGFRHLGKNIIHRRKVVQKQGQLHWTVEDHMLYAPAGMPMKQHWHPDADFFQTYEIRAFDEGSKEISMQVTEGWYSETYGEKSACNAIFFETMGRYIRTEISVCPTFL